jgi:hypothetical protein
VGSFYLWRRILLVEHATFRRRLMHIVVTIRVRKRQCNARVRHMLHLCHNHTRSSLQTILAIRIAQSRTRLILVRCSFAAEKRGSISCYMLDFRTRLDLPVPDSRAWQAVATISISISLASAASSATVASRCWRLCSLWPAAN